METVSEEPFLVLFHEIISEKEIETVKELARPKLGRSQMFRKDWDPNVANQISESRVSESGWLADEEHPVIGRISKRTSAVTGLNLASSEFLQVLNYGLAGHYEPHFDFSRPDETGAFEVWRGNRIATFIYYLSDVDSGGATAFLEAGTQVFPQRGSAAFWFNMKRNGNDGDYRTRHGGCPVICGSKWVANKWFHESGQEFTMNNCGLNQDDPFTEENFRFGSRLRETWPSLNGR